MCSPMWVAAPAHPVETPRPRREHRPHQQMRPGAGALLAGITHSPGWLWAAVAVLFPLALLFLAGAAGDAEALLRPRRRGRRRRAGARRGMAQIGMAAGGADNGRGEPGGRRGGGARSELDGGAARPGCGRPGRTGRRRQPTAQTRGGVRSRSRRQCLGGGSEELVGQLAVGDGRPQEIGGGGPTRVARPGRSPARRRRRAPSPGRQVKQAPPHSAAAPPPNRDGWASAAARSAATASRRGMRRGWR